MLPWWEIFTSLALALLGYYLWAATRKPKNFPPGPPRLPVVGSLPFLVRRSKNRQKGPPLLLHGAMQNVEKYGPLVGFWSGREPSCLIADFDMMKEVLRWESTSGRPSLNPFTFVRPGHKTMLERDKLMMPGIAFAYGPYWSEQRTFAIRTLKQFGFGKRSMEDGILDEADAFCDMLATARQGASKSVNLSKMFNISIMSSLWFIMTGEKMRPEDPKLIRIVAVLDRFLKESDNMRPVILSIFPRWMLGNWLGRKLAKFDLMKTVVDCLIEEVIHPMVEKGMERVKQEGQGGGRGDNFLDAYLAEVEKCSDPTSSFYKERGIAGLESSMIDLFFAGSETTSTSLIWTVLFLLHHPDVQRKVHDEIDGVVASSTPRLEHMDELHYTSAVLLECLRMVGLLPLSLGHVTLSEVRINGYVLPAGTNILPFLAHVVFNPKHFPEPHAFKPERFLSADGKYKPDERAQVVFGIGKRVCPGKTLAEKELFLFFTTMMQRFVFSNPPGQQLPSYHIDDMGHHGTSRSCPSFETVVKPRA